MDLLFSLFLVLHFAALVVGGATSVAMPLIGRQMAGAPPEVLARFGPVARRLSRSGQVAFAVLVVTGVLMVWLRYGGNAGGLGPWFIAKLVLVGAMLVALVVGAVAGPGKLNPRVFVFITRALLLGVIVCAVMAFG